MQEKSHKQLSEEYDEELNKIEDLHAAVNEANEKLKNHIKYLDELSRLTKEAKRKESGASELEIIFKLAVDEYLPKINVHLMAAKEELKKAKAIAEEHNLIFKSSVIDLSDYNDNIKIKNDIYMSKSFEKFYNNVDSKNDLYNYLKIKFGINIFSGNGNRFSSSGDTWLGCWMPSSMVC